jgi:nucleoside-diphosphate-sugar epimerase
MKTILVTGATGATGRLLVQQLLDRGLAVKAIVRSPDALPDSVRRHECLSLITAGILDIDAAELARHAEGCSAVVSCLGHTLNLRGIFGRPRRLVTDAVQRLCTAVRANAPSTPVRFVLMNTTGNGNRDLNEPRSFAERCIFGVLRRVLPPQADNEEAANYLRAEVGRSDKVIEWVVVRPDSLTDEAAVTEYTLHVSPTRSPVFNPGKTSRVNVGHFMTELICADETWSTWKGRMPVIYNSTSR